MASNICFWKCLGLHPSEINHELTATNLVPNSSNHVSSNSISNRNPSLERHTNLNGRAESIINPINKQSQITYADRIRGKQPIQINIAALPSPHSIGGIPTITLPKSMVERGIKYCEFALIGRVDFRKVSLKRLQVIAAELWCPASEWKIITLGKGFFLFKLSSKDDFIRVWSQSWKIGDQNLHFMKWSPDFDIEKQRTSNALLWVQFPKLKQQYWDYEALLTIGKCLGTPIGVDKRTLSREIGTYASVLIDIDMSRPIPSVVNVKEEDGKQFAQAVFIPKIPHFCSHCNSVGHTMYDCRNLMRVMDATGGKHRVNGNQPAGEQQIRRAEMNPQIAMPQPQANNTAVQIPIQSSLQQSNMIPTVIPSPNNLDNHQQSQAATLIPTISTSLTPHHVLSISTVEQIQRSLPTSTQTGPIDEVPITAVPQIILPASERNEITVGTLQVNANTAVLPALGNAEMQSGVVSNRGATHNHQRATSILTTTQAASMVNNNTPTISPIVEVQIQDDTVVSVPVDGLQATEENGNQTCTTEVTISGSGELLLEETHSQNMQQGRVEEVGITVQGEVTVTYVQEESKTNEQECSENTKLQDTLVDQELNTSVVPLSVNGSSEKESVNTNENVGGMQVPQVSTSMEAVIGVSAMMHDTHSGGAADFQQHQSVNSNSSIGNVGAVQTAPLILGNSFILLGETDPVPESMQGIMSEVNLVTQRMDYFLENNREQTPTTNLNSGRNRNTVQGFCVGPRRSQRRR